MYIHIFIILFYAAMKKKNASSSKQKYLICHLKSHRLCFNSSTAAVI